MSEKLVGYRVKRNLKKGDILSDTNGLTEPIYEPKTLVEELADIAREAVYRSGYRFEYHSLINKINRLEEEIRGE